MYHNSDNINKIFSSIVVDVACIYTRKNNNNKRLPTGKSYKFKKYVKTLYINKSFYQTISF